MLNLFRRSAARSTVERLYGVIVAQSRQPTFYTDFGVPDTIDGRFEMMVLHTFLLCHRLKDGDARARELSQEIFDAFVDDMDRTLREMGVGDLSVPKKMKKIGAAFYGRAAAYDAALAEAGDEALVAALTRNVYGRGASAFAAEGEAAAAAAAAAPAAGAEDVAGARLLAGYVRAAALGLAATAAETLAAGRLEFPAPRANGG